MLCKQQKDEIKGLSRFPSICTSAVYLAETGEDVGSCYFVLCHYKKSDSERVDWSSRYNGVITYAEYLAMMLEDEEPCEHQRDTVALRFAKKPTAAAR